MNTIIKKLSPFILLAAGILFIILGISSLNAKKNYTSVEGVISNIETVSAANADESDDHIVKVKYSVDGKEYEEELGSYSSSMKVGNKIALLYDPSNPSTIVEKSSTGNIIEIAFGAFAIICGLVLLIKKIVR